MFRLISTQLKARRGEFSTAHGTFQTPVFMNVATCGAIRGGVSANELKDIFCKVVLCNTYHLDRRPSSELIKKLGGLHKFIGWNGPILTDSGGFQVFSLSRHRKISEEGVSFSSYLDGQKVLMTPERSIQIQANLGSDIAMAFDECIPLPCDDRYVAASAARTARWLERCKAEHIIQNAAEDAVNPHQALFGINQGGTNASVRIENMQAISSLDLDGYAIGGLSVGEEREDMLRVISAVEPFMPEDKPRYLMGVGTPSDILEAVNLGVDMFDCVLPLEVAHRGNVFTEHGKMRLLAEKYKEDPRPIAPECDCPVCRTFSRAYIRHLIKADERLGMRLCILHNLYFYNTFTEKIRQAIDENTFDRFYLEFRDVIKETRND